jgi:hypothetical protein
LGENCCAKQQTGERAEQLSHNTYILIVRLTRNVRGIARWKGRTHAIMSGRSGIVREVIARQV